MPERPAANDPFYIGYEERMPPGIAKCLRPAILVLLVALPILALALVAAQRPFDVAFFEFGAAKRFTGTLVADPYPVLQVERPGQAGGPSRYLLVTVGKHGLDQAARALAGQVVALEGTLIFRDDQTMLEVVPGTLEAVAGNTTALAPPSDHGTRTLRGEIVDSKCFLGVMKPGFGKPHRACAALCIRGGIPPIFISRTPDTPAAYLLLVGDDGRAVNDDVLAFVAETVEITGEVVTVGDQQLLRADVSSIRRLPEKR